MLHADERHLNVVQLMPHIFCHICVHCHVANIPMMVICVAASPTIANVSISLHASICLHVLGFDDHAEFPI